MTVSEYLQNAPTVQPKEGRPYLVRECRWLAGTDGASERFKYVTFIAVVFATAVQFLPQGYG